MIRNDALLRETRLLDFSNPKIQALIDRKNWRELPIEDRIREAYDFVRDEIAFGYNADDAIPASRILVDGYGQCNTKAILLMALFRALGIPCKLHGFKIHKQLQRGVIPEPVYIMAPEHIVHSWVEVKHNGEWLKLEGFILDVTYLGALQSAYPNRKSLCAYAVGTDMLANPPVKWNGGDTFIQATGITEDLGLWDTPDEFYTAHGQNLNLPKKFLYQHVIRHWMNMRVKKIRKGKIPAIPDARRKDTEIAFEIQGIKKAGTHSHYINQGHK